MLLEMFFNFDGNCREATAFYAKVFHTKVTNLMTYGDTSPDNSEGWTEAQRQRVMYAGVPFENMVLMCMDVPTDYPLIIGTNISPTLSFADKREVRRVFRALAKEGTIHTDLSQTFFSELYGSVTDQFGINWQILHYKPLEEEGSTTQKDEASPETETPKKPTASAKARHRWSPQIGDTEFKVDSRGAKATVIWQKRGEVLIKKGAKLLKDPPLNKDGSLGFSSRGGLMIRDEQKDAIKNYVTTRDVVLKSVNEVGLFLYFGGTNSWLELKDKDGKTIHDLTVVA